MFGKNPGTKESGFKLSSFESQAQALAKGAADDAAENASDESRPTKAVKFLDLAIKIGIYALAFLLPLFFLPFTANVLELNKQFLLFFFASVLMVLWMAKVLALRRFEVTKSLLNVFVVLFLASAFLSALFSGTKYGAFFGLDSVIAESFVSLVSLAIIFFITTNSLRTERQISNLLLTIIGSAFLAGVFGILQMTETFILPWVFAKSAAFNTIGSANSLEIFIAAALVMAVTLFADKKRPFWQVVALTAVSLFFLFVLIAMNFSNVWRALIGVMAVVIGIGIMKKGQISQTKLILSMVILGMAMILTLTKINISGQWLITPVEVSPSLDATMDINKGALSENLFFGSGPGSFGYNWERFRSELINQTVFWNVRFSQGISKVFSMPASLGIIGSVFWVLVMVFFAVFGFWRLINKKYGEWNLAFSFFSGWLFLAVMQFLYPSNLALEFLFWLLMGVSLYLLRNLRSQEQEDVSGATLLSFRRESPLASVFSFVLVIMLVFGISFFYMGVHWWRADILFNKGLAASNESGDLAGGIALVTKASTVNPYKDSYLVALSQMAMLQVEQEFVKPKTAERDQNIQNLIAGAINISKQATDLNPRNPDSWMQRAIVYRSVLGYLSGAEDWMISSFNEATKLQPKNPYVFWEFGRGYLLLSDYAAAQQGSDEQRQTKMAEYLNQAEGQFNKAVEVKPDYSQAHYQLALIYDRLAKVDQAIEKMELTRASFPNDIGISFQLGLLYYKKENWDLARSEFERSLTMDSNYSNARYFLGLIYDRQGDKPRALEQFQKIAEFNPENQEVVKIIQNLQAGKGALDGIAPPGPSPEDRGQAPVQEKASETK